MNLRVAGVGEEGAALVGAAGGRDVAVHGVGGQVEDRPIAARGQHDRVADERFDLARYKIPRDDAARLAVDDDEVEHLGARVHGHAAGVDLAAEGLVGAEQELLAGLTAAIKGARHLGAAERAVGQLTAVLARERHALGDALVDDVHADLGEAIDVGLARTEVAALDGIVEKAINAIAVVLIVLGGVDAALGGDGVARRGESWKQKLST